MYREQGNIEAPANLGSVQNVMGLLFSLAVFSGACLCGWMGRASWSRDAVA